MLFAFAFLIVSVFIPAVLADPTVEQVTIYPSEPLPLSTILFNATILSNESIDEVRLLAQECREDLCFIDKWNESMSMINGMYQTTITLIHKEATQIKYQLKITYNETWYTSNTTIIPLAIDTIKNTSQDPHDPVSTPGFELSVVIAPIAFILIFNHWIKKSCKKP